ncbi:MAG: NAD(P) transhydrogenase subunit alpha [Chitinophagaceae bacterium]|jgi:NAD(P) transhydrogenase subunit alpha|nr:NAD(P) transhydrogenase subunit alpha [Chitinophagaceae bacterium]
MVLGILKAAGDERRVVMIPDEVATLVKMKVKVLVETGAGEKAFFTNDDYTQVGAEIATRNDIFSSADLLLQINPFTAEEIDKTKAGQSILSILNPLADKPLVEHLLQKKITAFGLDIVPRTTRAQAMDILSSMATVAGYKAVLTAANILPQFFPMFMSAAGSIKPAKVLILGAGVAGLQSIATARKLGAVVEVFDVRAAVKEEVMSLGGKFVEVEGATDSKAAGGYAVEQTEDFLKKQKEAIHNSAVKANVVICTAQIPGKQAPLLLLKDTVEKMPRGAVIIDLASSTGGNCEVTKDNETIVYNGVTVIGNSNLAATLPIDASRMFGKNVINFLKLIIDGEGALNLNFEDDIVKGTCVTHNGAVMSDRVKSFLNL